MDLANVGVFKYRFIRFIKKVYVKGAEESLSTQPLKLIRNKIIPIFLLHL